MCEKNTLWDKSRYSFCGATQIDGTKPARSFDVPTHTVPCNGGTPSGSTGKVNSVRPALGSPFGRAVHTALPPPAALLGKRFPAYSSASSVSLQRFSSLNCPEYSKLWRGCQAVCRNFGTLPKENKKTSVKLLSIRGSAAARSIVQNSQGWRGGRPGSSNTGRRVR